MDKQLNKKRKGSRGIAWERGCYPRGWNGLNKGDPKERKAFGPAEGCTVPGGFTTSGGHRLAPFGIEAIRSNRVFEIGQIRRWTLEEEVCKFTPGQNQKNPHKQTDRNQVQVWIIAPPLTWTPLTATPLTLTPPHRAHHPPPRCISPTTTSTSSKIFRYTAYSPLTRIRSTTPLLSSSSQTITGACRRAITTPTRLTESTALVPTTVHEAHSFRSFTNRKLRSHLRRPSNNMQITGRPNVRPRSP